MRALPLTSTRELVDTFGRRHNNLRISVTDRCNLRCTYCMTEDATFVDRAELLTFEEIARFVRIAAGLGVDKVRLTGGEPLLRRDLHRLVAQIAAIPGIRDIGLTTNGLLLEQQARSLAGAGLRRINISLDTLDRARFRLLARRDGLERVLAGIAAAESAGFEPIKLNAVILRGINDRDIVPLARFARDHGHELRFIEYMPIGADHWERQKVFTAAETLELIEDEIGPLVPATDTDPSSPATEYRYLDGVGRIGVIGSVSRPFCATCNRIRLTAEGALRNCLFATDEIDLRPLLRGGASDEAIAARILGNVLAKGPGHEIDRAQFVKPARTMHAIGG